MKLSYFVHTSHANGALVLDVDIPPSLNHLYGTTVFTDSGGSLRSRRYLTADGKNYKEAVMWETKSKANAKGWEYKGGRIALAIGLRFPNKKRRDISNCIKILEDAIAETLGFDDRVVDSILVQRVGINKERPGAVVTVEEYSENHKF
jgi:Holliday junction resolvase RusA-like endonuclease